MNFQAILGMKTRNHRSEQNTGAPKSHLSQVTYSYYSSGSGPKVPGPQGWGRREVRAQSLNKEARGDPPTTEVGLQRVLFQGEGKPDLYPYNHQGLHKGLPWC